MHETPVTRTAPAALLGDGAALRDILSLAGPDLWPRFLDQIILDIDGAAKGLGAAIVVRDWDLIRTHSHVLISLAGTVGAMGLHGDACTLNEAAHDRDLPQILRLAPDFASRLAALTAQLAAHRSAQ